MTKPKDVARDRDQPTVSVRTDARELAESVAHFLYWSGWLEHRHASAVVFMHGMGEPSFHAGTKTFQRLETALDEAFPDWETWNTNYSKGTR